MKTHLSTAATICVLALLFGACNKDNSTQPSQSLQNDPIERLRSFHGQIRAARTDPCQRSQETLSLSDALWDVENHFNMTYTNPEQYYSRTVNHAFTLTLPVNESQQVLVSDAIDLYDQIVEEARQSLASDTFDLKGLVSLHISQEEEENHSLTLTIETKSGERSSYSPPINYLGGPFGADDNWMFGSPLGKCDDPDIPSGADKQLQEKLFDKLIGTLPEADPGQRNIFIDRKVFVFDGLNYAGIFHTDNEDELCIPYLEMNRYYNNEKKIITTTIPEQYNLANYEPISIEISGIFNEYDNIYTHRNEIEYAKVYRVSIEEFGDVEDLLMP